jgi:hypothetical protein
MGATFVTTYRNDRAAAEGRRRTAGTGQLPKPLGSFSPRNEKPPVKRTDAGEATNASEKQVRVPPKPRSDVQVGPYGPTWT